MEAHERASQPCNRGGPMRAAVLERLAGPDGIGMGDRPEPQSNGASVLVDVYAAGVSFPDLLLSQGLYQMRPEVPFVMGLEAAGVVVDAPQSSDVRPGQRVVVTSFGSWA